MQGPPLAPSKPMLQTQLVMSELASATVTVLAGHDVQLGLLYADAKVLRRQAANHTAAKDNRSEERGGPSRVSLCQPMHELRWFGTDLCTSLP